MHDDWLLHIECNHGKTIGLVTSKKSERQDTNDKSENNLHGENDAKADLQDFEKQILKSEQRS